MKNIIFFVVIIIILQSYNAQASPKDPLIPPFSKYGLVHISDIKTEGWIHQFLEYQRSGLTGHIELAGFPFNTGMWTERINEKPEGIFWWPYEQTGYYVDGCIKTGYLLNDTLLLNKAKYQINYTLQHPQNNGRLGPDKLIGRWSKWPYTGFLRSFMTEYNETNDPKIIDAMHKHYLSYTAEDFQDELDVCNLEEICWLFGKTKDSALLRMAEKSYALFKSNSNNRNRDGKDIDFTSDKAPDYHGVVYLEIVKIPAILYSYTGKEPYLDEAIHGIEMMEKYHMLASGVPSSTEHFHGKSETEGHESCNLATLPYTYGMMLQITGNPVWADKIEKAVFNAAIGAITTDFKAHQYFSSPNQMISTLNSNHFGYNNAREAYLPGHDTECCTGNINRFMPYFCMQMWLTTKDNGLAAALFGPSEITAKVGRDNLPVTIIQKTKYPFDETIDFEIKTNSKVSFDFQIRIPAWCDHSEIFLNGKKINSEIKSGTFYTLNREFSNGDKISLRLPMKITQNYLPNNGISLERGPIVYCFPIKDSTVVKKYSEDTSKKPYKKPVTEYTVTEYYPKGSWNYCLLKSEINHTEVIKNEKYLYPWESNTAPVKIRISAKKVTNWELKKSAVNNNAIDYSQTPSFPKELKINDKDQVIELVPYGCTKLRVTVFPFVNN
jgi:hypothetical protein